MNQPSLVKKNFNRAKASYQHSCQPQLIAGRRLIEKLTLHRQSAHHIIDLGCGTGVVSRLLLDRIPAQQYTGIDFATELIQQASNHIGRNATWLMMDFDRLSFTHCANIVFSNMALHWSKDFKKIIASIFHILTDDGLLAFSIPLQHCFYQLDSSQRNHFISFKQCASLLQRSNFQLLHVSQYYSNYVFNSQYEALRHIKSTGANTLLNRTTGQLCRQQLMQKREFALSYHIGLFIARKPL